MNREEFDYAISKHTTRIYKERGARGKETPYDFRAEDKKQYRIALFDRVHTGGLTGGNCWDDTIPRYEAATYNKPSTLLHDVIVDIAPDLPYRLFEKLKSKVVTESEDTEHDYYGNTEDYKATQIDINTLYNFLCDELWEKE